MKKQNGFTLIELVVVLTIIAVLAAIAMPAYKAYTIRSKVTEALSLAAGYQVEVADAYAVNGVEGFPAVPITVFSPSKYIASITESNDGSIQVQMNMVALGLSVLDNESMVFLYPLQRSPTLYSQPHDGNSNPLVWACATSTQNTADAETPNGHMGLAIPGVGLSARFAPPSCT